MGQEPPFRHPFSKENKVMNATYQNYEQKLYTESYAVLFSSVDVFVSDPGGLHVPHVPFSHEFRSAVFTYLIGS